MGATKASSKSSKLGNKEVKPNTKLLRLSKSVGDVFGGVVHSLSAFGLSSDSKKSEGPRCIQASIRSLDRVICRIDELMMDLDCIADNLAYIKSDLLGLGNE